MSAQGWVALVLGVAGVVVTAVALVAQFRRLTSGRQRPAASVAMTPARRRRATRQLRRGRPVAGDEVVAVTLAARWRRGRGYLEAHPGLERSGRAR